MTTLNQVQIDALSHADDLLSLAQRHLRKAFDEDLQHGEIGRVAMLTTEALAGIESIMIGNAEEIERQADMLATGGKREAMTVPF